MTIRCSAGTRDSLELDSLELGLESPGLSCLTAVAISNPN